MALSQQQQQSLMALATIVRNATVDPEDKSLLNVELVDIDGAKSGNNVGNFTHLFRKSSAEEEPHHHARHLIADSSSRNVQLPIEWLLDNDQKLRHVTGQRVTSVFDTYPTLEGLPHIESVCGPWNAEERAAKQEGEDGLTLEELRDRLFVKLSDESELIVKTHDIILYGARPGLVANSTATFLVEDPKVDIHVKHFNFHKFVSRNEQNLRTGAGSGSGSTAAGGGEESASNNNNEPSCFGDALLALARDGLIIIDGCPNSPDAVTDLAKRIDVVQPTLYGDSWTVQTAPTQGPKNNVAYTAEYLDFHHDLVYYQSPPGLQLLHCLKFEDTVEGGESIFLDAFMVAEELRKRDPESFKTLCQIPAAFMKDDIARANPAQFYYATPHIHVNHEGTITEMRWAPAFEAPLPVQDAASCRAYYKARASFLRVMNELRAKHTLKFRLQPGQCVVFQQTRVLHGRERFIEPEPHSRILRGCYVNIDAYWNKVAVEVRKRYGLPLTIPRGNRTFH